MASLGERAVLDEVQRAPELLLPIKASVDRNRRAGRFVLTGFEAYLTTLIQRDVRDLAAIEGVAHLPRLLQSVRRDEGWEPP